MLSKETKSHFETLNERSLDDVTSDENNEVVRMQVSAEKDLSYKSNVVRYITLKMYGVQRSQVPRHQEQNLSPDNEA